MGARLFWFDGPAFGPHVSVSLLNLPEGVADQALLFLRACWKGNRCEKSGVSLTRLSFSHAFDTDDAALHACVAGLGMVLAPPILTTREIDSGALTALPGYDPVEIGTYRYLRHSESRVVRQFCSWLTAEMRNLE